MTHRNFPEPKGMSANCVFCPTNSPKPKDSLFTILNNKVKQQSITFKKLDPATDISRLKQIMYYENDRLIN